MVAPLEFNAACVKCWVLGSLVRFRVCYGDACLVACQGCYGDFQAAFSLTAPFVVFVGGFGGIAVALGFHAVGHQAVF